MISIPSAFVLQPAQAHTRPAARLLRALALGALAFILLRPVLGVAHELLVVWLAALLRVVSDAPIIPVVVARLPLDPVYTMALVQFAGEVHARGVAVAPPVGLLLNAALPAVFAPPELVVDTWASAVLEPGATVLARSLAGFGADVGLLAVGMVLFLAGLRGRSWLAVCGALQQAHVLVYHFLDTAVSLPDLEAAGLPFAVASLVSDPSHRAPWFTQQLAGLPGPAVSVLAGLLSSGLAYLIVVLLLGTPWLAWRLARRPRGVLGQRGRPTWALRLRPAFVLGLGVLVLAVTPIGAFAATETRVLSGAASVAGLLGSETSAADRQAAATELSLIPRPASGPVSVSVIGGRYHYALLVGGVPRVVRGMGYNVQYGQLGPDERARRYDRDFGAMRQAGVNTIFGWFQDQFDGLTLARARQYGLGVAMPYELNQDLNYDDPALRAQVTHDVLAWVAQYKDDPAVWFWSPGNEVIHRLIFPSWVKHERDLAREARADSFARFYVGLIDQIHALDPVHPIVYRDAEDIYLPRIRDALLRDGVARPWFIYGTNVYSRRLGEILQNWPNQGLDAPLLVSEFSPGGTGPIDRPPGLRAMWSTIRSNSDWVIGGAVYTWTTDGPEELDKVFGLVDGTGQPRDDSLATIAQLYRADGKSQ